MRREREREQERERVVGVIILRSVRFSSNVMRLSVTPLRAKKKSHLVLLRAEKERALIRSHLWDIIQKGSE